MADDGFKGTEAENSKEMLSLHEMFRIVGDEMTPKDVGALKTANGIVSGDLLGKVSDGRGYLIALERLGQIDETNFKQIFQLLTWTKRHDLYPYVTLRRRKTVVPDPVDEYLEETSHNSIKKRRCFEQSRDDSRDSCIAKSLSDDTTLLPGKYEKGLKNKNTKKGHRGRRSRKQPLHEELKHEEDEIKKKVTCDIRLRVRAEYCHHDNVLEGNVFSNKPELVERQFEKFAQANTILKSRDLGSIICDIKFSELTYLDAFWRDYINGSLLEALKGVFITESLKQAVGHEAIKLLVNVDEDDYEAGRLQLLQNLKE